MAITAPTSVLSTSLVRRVINGVVVRQPDIKLNKLIYVNAGTTEINSILRAVAVLNFLNSKHEKITTATGLKITMQ